MPNQSAPQMIPYSQDSDLKTGDVLVTSSVVPFINHFAIMYYQNGIKTVADNSFLSGKVDIFTLEDYKKARNIIGVMRNDVTQSLTDEAIQLKVEEARKINYRFFSFNCEDFVRKVCGCDIGFDQRKKYIMLVLFIIFSIIIISYIARKG